MLRANKLRRLFIGICVLIFVNILWVSSSELTKYIFEDENFHRPFFTTYFKTSMFTIYLLGFVFHRPWREQCFEVQSGVEHGDVNYSLLENEETEDYMLSEPEFDRLRVGSDSTDDQASAAVSDSEIHAVEAEGVPDTANEITDDQDSSAVKSVRFKPTTEVRRLPQSEAEAAVLSRLSYEVFLRYQHRLTMLKSKLPLRQVLKLSLKFAFVWFIGNYAYAMALNSTQAAIVNVISSTSSLFTLVFAAIFPAVASDRFSVSKLVAVGFSVGGVSLITFTDFSSIEKGIPIGAIWAIIGAISYAIYVVFLRKSAESEDKLDITMFFGFVGLFCVVFLWPVFYVLDVTNQEHFHPLPNRTQLILITVNGLVGTVLADLLWLWGCFLTSSLIATLALSLSVPMSLVADNILRHQRYSWEIMLGSALVVLSFVAAGLLAHIEHSDPVMEAIQRLFKLLCLPCRKLRNKCRFKKTSANRHVRRDSASDGEQQRSLIGSEVT